jgi:hypothetical protein
VNNHKQYSAIATFIECKEISSIVHCLFLFACHCPSSRNRKSQLLFFTNRRAEKRANHTKFAANAEKKESARERDTNSEMSAASTSALSSFATRSDNKNEKIPRERKKKSHERQQQMIEQAQDDEMLSSLISIDPPTRAEHMILAWVSINPSVKRLCGLGLEPFREEIRFVLEGLLWREISMPTEEEEEEEEGSSDAKNVRVSSKRLWVKGMSVRLMMVFFILYPNYIVFALCAVFIRASLRARRRAASFETRGESNAKKNEEKNKKKNKEEDKDAALPRMSSYAVIVLETVADRLETIASIASGRDPLALRVACFACAWLFVLSFFVSFSAWVAAAALFATKPKGAKRILEACFR